MSCLKCKEPNFSRASDMVLSIREKDCPDCGGTGYHYSQSMKVGDHECPTCNGTGENPSYTLAPGGSLTDAY